VTQDQIFTSVHRTEIIQRLYNNLQIFLAASTIN